MKEVKSDQEREGIANPDVTKSLNKNIMLCQGGRQDEGRMGGAFTNVIQRRVQKG